MPQGVDERIDHGNRSPPGAEPIDHLADFHEEDGLRLGRDIGDPPRSRFEERQGLADHRLLAGKVERTGGDFCQRIDFGSGDLTRAWSLEVECD